jgi:hypothetical protein
MPHLTTPVLCFARDGAQILRNGTQAPGWDRDPSAIAIHRIDRATGAVSPLAATIGWFDRFRT